MKAAIITLFSDNYGNKLQNYALQTLLEKMGYETDTLLVKDGVKFHHPENAKEILAKFSPKYIIQVFSSRFKNKYPYKNQRDGLYRSLKLGKTATPSKLKADRANAFTVFSKQYIKTKNTSLNARTYDCSDDYDAYICGSDQIWNPTYGSTGSPYFLQFAPEYKRIAFAPSFGISRIADELKPLYRKWLNGIPFLSVREDKGAEIIKDLTGREVPVLPDPTLCLTKEQWELVEKEPSFAKHNYVLTYFLGNETNKYRKYIESYSKRIGAEIIDLFDMREPEYYTADPSEFVWLVHHAKAMFTDSFHGTVFSLIFHTPFLTFDRVESGGNAISSRINTLLGITKLEHRKFGCVSVNRFDDIDFSFSDTAIFNSKEKAIIFLRNALDSIAENNKISVISNESDTVQRFKQDCTGCAACVDICPVNCITMQEDEEGFRYPKIDLEKCIHCDQCRKLCDEAQRPISVYRNEKAFVAYTKDTTIRKKSSSGGMFSEFANHIIDLGGSVYGAGFADDWSVVHRYAENKKEIEKLRGSKYVQSNCDNCYAEIKQKLELGLPVYFSGTPCQVDGLLAYLGKEYDKLITQDIICHGVPSPSIWKTYLELRSEGKKIKGISFRDKTYGWHYFSMNIETDSHRYIKRADEDIYIRLFLENLILRPSCYACHHKHLYRKADITIADCWGKTYGIIDKDKGISLAFANTDKGQRLLSDIQSHLELREIFFEEASSAQGAMTKSVPYNQNRELFFSMAHEKGMEDTIKNWYGFDKPIVLKRKMNYRKFKIAKLMRK